METEHIEKFIEDAIAGGYYSDILQKAGWNYAPKRDSTTTGYLRINWNRSGDCYKMQSDETTLLDPEAWKAVGKTRGWYPDKEHIPNSWLTKWSTFIDHLAGGKTINQALEAINN